MSFGFGKEKIAKAVIKILEIGRLKTGKNGKLEGIKNFTQFTPSI